MHRRTFVRLLAAAASAKAAAGLDAAEAQQSSAPPAASPGPGPARTDLPTLRVVSRYAPAATPGMPGPYPGRVVSVKSDKCVDTATDAANDEVVREMMARGMRTLTGAGTTPDAWRRFFEPVGRRRHQGQLRRLSALRLRVRDRGRSRPPADGDRRAGVADLRLRAVSESARRGELRAASAGRRADRRGRARQPERRQQRLRSRDLPRGGSLRRRRHAVEHDAARVAAPHEDHQHPEHEGPRRDRRHRLPEEHRLRQLLQRRAHAPARQVAHLFGRRHARRDGAAALEDRAADHGRPARRVARRSVRENDALRLLSRRQIMFGTDPVAIDRLLLDIIDDEAPRRTARSRSGIVRPRR